LLKAPTRSNFSTPRQKEGPMNMVCWRSDAYILTRPSFSPTPTWCGKKWVFACVLALSRYLRRQCPSAHVWSLRRVGFGNSQHAAFYSYVIMPRRKVDIHEVFSHGFASLHYCLECAVIRERVREYAQAFRAKIATALCQLAGVARGTVRRGKS
jgi:hypothetical protein